jgi:penicillin-binding protein 1A
MRSDRDKRTDTEKEIDDFLSQFETPADEITPDISSYLDDSDLNKVNEEPSFNWKSVDHQDLKRIGKDDQDGKSKEDSKKEDSVDEPKDTSHRRNRRSNSRKNRNSYHKKSHKDDTSAKAENAPSLSAGSDDGNAGVTDAIVSIPAEEIKAALEAELEKSSSEVKSAITEVNKSDKKDSSKDHKSHHNDGKKSESEEKSGDKSDDKHKEKHRDEPKDKNSSEGSISHRSENKQDRKEDKSTDNKEATHKPDKSDKKDVHDKTDKSDAKDRTDKQNKSGSKDKTAVYKVDKNKRRSRDFKDTQTVRAVSDATLPGEPSATLESEIEDALSTKHSRSESRRQSSDSEISFKRSKKEIKAKKAKKADKTGRADKSGKSVRGKLPAIKKPDLSETRFANAARKAGVGEKSAKEILFLKENPDYDPSQGDTYVKDGKTIKNKKYKVSFLKILRDMVAVGLVFILCGVIFALGCIISAPKYDYKDIYSAVDTASIVYDDQGKPVDNVFYTENRKIIKYKDMPEDLINSFVAIEDKTFWKHHGFNWTRMIGAVLSSLSGNGRISGTSTITQQLARNVYLADTKSVRSIKRKLLEMYYASRIEHSLSKEEIIEAYLNTIYLGHGCYGVNAAARTYFSKDVKDLDLIECASLAALPQSPDTYALLKIGSEAQDAVDSKKVATEPETIVTNDLAKERRQLTLDLMLDQGFISQKQHDKVYDLRLNDYIKPSVNSQGNYYSYFHEYLVDTIIADLVEQRKMTSEDAERMVYTKGLQIYSTLDSTAQKVIVDEFKDDSNFPYVTAPRDADGNMLNNDGEIMLYRYDNDFDEKGNFTLSGENGDVKVNSDGSVTIMKDKKLHIYETEVEAGTDYSIEFKSYYLYDDNDILYSISGGYINIPMDYKSLDDDGNVVISADFFNDPMYEDNAKIKGKDLIIRENGYTLNGKSRQPQAAMTIVGVGTGELKAMVGGRTSGGQKLLNRTLNPRQPGSSIKPLAVYGAALQKSYDLSEAGKKWKLTDFKIDKQGTKGWGDYITTHSSVEDEKCHIEGRDWPNNFNNSFSGKNTFMTAIQQSINTCAVKIELQVGDDYSLNQVKKFGITTVQDDTSNPVNDANPAALALGAMTNGVTPLEMSLAYAAFPAGGKVNTPICYYKVLDRNGEVLLESKSEQSEALNEGVAWIMTNTLQTVVNANRYLYVEGVQCGGKTGTTNDQYDIWFDGFTPSYAGSIWIGTDENVEMSSMSRPAATLWGVIMNQIPNAKKGEYAEPPANVIRTAGCYFTKGTETGLTSWSDKEAREKAKKEAYKKWLKEREKHKVWVEDTYKDVEVVDKEAWIETTTEIIGYEKNPDGTDDPTRPIYKTIEHPAEKHIEKVVDVPGHFEYEKGWRDGDFKYKGD